MNCRITIFAERPVTKGRGRARRTTLQGVAWQGWNADPRQEAAHARLPGSGSFYWPGPREAYRAAVVAMRADDTIRAVRIEGIGAQPVAYLRRADVAPRFGCHPGQPELIARFG